ncbi:DC-STAMP domain-containing protein 2-like [Argopecten irradians]|uniref:DC-STAMP domain-containing protein 2-like n=1 Tax=Argopecten irradians TaxID=31199 RepID=UPI0037124EBB
MKEIKDTADAEKPTSRWRRIKNNPDLFLHKLLCSRGDAHRCLKAFFGVLWGFIAGGLFFALITFSFGYDYDIAGWITIGVTVIMCLGLAVSTYFRCVVVMMVPTLCTGRGRVAIMAAIFGILLSGPVMNISHNANQVSTSMACTSELIYNQSKLLRKQLEEPIRKIAREIEDSFANLQEIGRGFQQAIEPVKELIEAFNGKIQEAANAVANAAKQCQKGVDRVHQQCVDGINKARRDCEDELGVVDNAIDTVGDGVVDTIDTIGGGINTGIDAISGGFDSIGSFFGKKRRRKRACDWSLPWQRGQTMTLKCQPKTRHKRFISGLCKVLDISDVCDVVKVGTGLCTVLDVLQDITKVALRETRDIIYTLANFFEFGVNSNSHLYGDINSSQTAAQIMSNVRADIQGRTEFINGIIRILNYLLIISVLFLFLRSAIYVKNYQEKDYFDNKYITKRFKKYDDRRKELGKKSVLPLKKVERNKYIEARSILLSPAELKRVKNGAVILSLQFLIAVVVVIADYVLYYVLTVMQQFGKINVSVSGNSDISLLVQGNGFIAKLVESLLTVLEIDTDYKVDFNITQCLPDPHVPDVQTNYVLLCLFFLAFIFVFTQAYGTRMHTKIAGYFYPDQEFERIMYLHEQITLKRKSKLLWFAKNLMSRRKRNAVISRFSFQMLFSNHCPDNCRPKSETTCLGCKDVFNGVAEFHICQTPGCDGVYCMDCLQEMGGKCTVCATTNSNYKSMKRGRGTLLMSRKEHGNRKQLM